jgi:serralysin
MAAPSISQIADALLFPNEYWSGSQITYSFPRASSTWPSYAPTDEQTDPHYAALSDDEADYFRDAAWFWDLLITPKLTETNDLTATGQIRVAYTDVDKFAEENVSAYAYGPPPGGSSGVGWMGDVWLDYALAGEGFFGRGGYVVMLHELGHALGLKHPFEEGATLPADYDNVRYTIMSYTPHADSRFRVVEQGDGGPQIKTYFASPITPMVFDIAAIQQRYGADPTTGAGDNVYTPDMDDAPALFAYYDAGGIDELNLSLLTRGSIVDLNPGAYSSLSYWSAADQAAYWTALHPSLAGQIASAFSEPGTFTWSNNLGLAYTTVIENFRGGAAGETVTGNAVANTLRGNGGSDRIFGALGDDSIEGGDGLDYLRGDEGSDRLAGGAEFDDINGNMGNDTASGGLGGDWVVGGRDNDKLDGDEGDDIVYGNLGADWCDGGEGNDIVRGGQENDVLLGQGGNDWMSGDRGDDTITGGTGADIFHSFGDAGLDQVTDFNRAEGDRVLLDAGTTYTASQSGADVLITMGGGGRVVLAGVSLASLSGDWIAVG